MMKRTLVALLLAAIPHIAMAQSTPRPMPRPNVPAGAEAADPGLATRRTAPTTTDTDDQQRSGRSNDTYYRITTPWANNPIRPAWQR